MFVQALDCARQSTQKKVATKHISIHFVEEHMQEGRDWIIMVFNECLVVCEREWERLKGYGSTIGRYSHFKLVSGAAVSGHCATPIMRIIHSSTNNDCAA